MHPLGVSVICSVRCLGDGRFGSCDSCARAAGSQHFLAILGSFLAVASAATLTRKKCLHKRNRLA